MTGFHRNKMWRVLAVLSWLGNGGAADGMGHWSSSCYTTAGEVYAEQWIPNEKLWLLGAGLSSMIFMAEFGVREYLYLQVHVTFNLQVRSPMEELGSSWCRVCLQAPNGETWLLLFGNASPWALPFTNRSAVGTLLSSVLKLVWNRSNAWFFAVWVP